MVRGGKEENGTSAAGELNPEKEERKRLKRLALSKSILSEIPAKASSVVLSPSKTVIKHHGKDILRKCQRKNRYLFSFPGLLSPLSGGKIGELKDLGTKNPVLYLDFPQGQMKLFGTIVYPKNRYLTLQFSRGGKNVTCEDYFDTMVVFSDAWWIGKKDENPEEVRLDFPKELNVGQYAEPDFQGGAGATCKANPSVERPEMKSVEQESPKTESEDDLSDSPKNLKDLIEVTPTRQSVRTAGKRYNFAEAASGDDSDENDAETSEGEENKAVVEHPTRDYSPGKTVDSSTAVLDINNEDAAGCNQISEQVQNSSASVSKSKEFSRSNPTSLVQPTVSTLLMKMEEKKATRNKSLSASKASSQNLQHTDSKQKTDEQDERTRKKRKVIEERKAGIESITKKKQPKTLESIDAVQIHKRKTKCVVSPVATTRKKGKTNSSPAPMFVPASSSQVEDDIEEFSSTSKDDESDEDWAA